MRLSQKVRYAVACLFELAKFFGEIIDTQEIAAHQNIPVAYAHKVLQGLSRAGLVIAQKGRGYQLARPLQDITVLEVIEALSTADEVEANKSDIGSMVEARVNNALAGLTLARILAH